MKNKFDVRTGLGSIFAIIFWFAVLIFLLSPKMRPSSEAELEYAAADAAHTAQAGLICNKEIVSLSSEQIGEQDTQYLLFLEVEFEYEGEMHSAVKDIYVDKETYLKAEVGMWYDLRTMEMTEREASESLISTCPNCKEAVASKFCPGCGWKAVEDQASVCSECGAEWNSAYCGNCGALVNHES